MCFFVLMVAVRRKTLCRHNILFIYKTMDGVEHGVETRI